MDQDEINRAEWADAENWSGPDWAAVYFSKRDTRTWVPKQVRALGWTVNLGQPAGARWLLTILVGVPVLLSVLFALALAIATG